MTPAELARLHASAFPQARAWSEAEFHQLMNQDTVFLFTNAHGFGLGRIAGPEMEMLTLAVHPDHRRKGLGAELVAQFEAYGLRFGCDTAFLEVDETNGPALSLYQRHGYQHVGTRPNYYVQASGQRTDALVMRKDLAA